jgi:hypothetical protein
MAHTAEHGESTGRCLICVEIQEAVEAERERCAQVCRDIAHKHDEDAAEADDKDCRDAHWHWEAAADECAEAIEKGGK